MVRASNFLSTSTAEKPNLTADEFFAPGTYNWTVPAGVTRIFAAVIGAGGSGGSHRHATTQTSACGGGGGGYTHSFLDVTPGQVLTVNIGAGGAGVDNASGNPGGTSSLTGTGINLQATGGQGGGSKGLGNNPALGGTGSGGEVSYTGGSGGASDTARYHATGGGAAGTYLGNGGNGGEATASYSNGDGTGGGNPGGADAPTDSSLVTVQTPVPVLEERIYFPGTLGVLPSLTSTGENTHSYNGASVGIRNVSAVDALNFGGAGGAHSSSSNPQAGAGDIGGGGGGATRSQNANATSGKGGDGYVCIVYEYAEGFAL